MTVTLAVSKHACIEQQKVYACFGPPHTQTFSFSFTSLEALMQIGTKMTSVSQAALL